MPRPAGIHRPGLWSGVGVALVAAVACILVWSWHRRGPLPPAPAATSPRTAPVNSVSSKHAHPPDPATEPAPVIDAATVAKILDAIQHTGDRVGKLSGLLSASGTTAADVALLDQIRALLTELAVRLRSLPNDVVVAAMMQYLQSGRDVVTGLRFTVGEGGLLAEAPTLRTFLLDLFADLDAIGARDYSLSIFDSSGSASEWALAMRNIAWQDDGGESRDLLHTRLSELLNRQEWLQQPAPGFLEAFDVAVHLGDKEALHEMGSVLGLRDAAGTLAGNGITHAAFLALDRITAANPGQTVDLIRSEPDFLSWAPRHRGALMSRLDPRDGQQGAAAGDYLRRGDVGEEERFAFLRLFPNQNGSLGDSLISEPATQTPAFSSALERDRAALELIREWLADPGYAALRGELLRSEARLAGFVAGGAGAASASSPAKTP